MTETNDDSASIPATAFAILLFIIALYNLSKIPWYLGCLKTPSYGFEASVPFSPLGFRARKLISHPSLFLAPHALMGSCLLSLFGLYMLYGYSKTLGKTFFGLAVVFVVHAYPERAGVPNRYSGKPINQVASATVLIGCVLGWFLQMPQLGMSIALLPLLGAAVLEAKGPIPFCVKKALGQSVESESPDGDSPLPRNMDGYTGICPCAKFFDIDKTVYGDAEYTPIVS